MDDQPDCRKHQYEHVRAIEGTLEYPFENHRKGEPGEQKTDCVEAADANRIGNDVNADDTRDRNEDEPVEHLSRVRLALTVRVRQRSKNERDDAQCKCHS